MVASSTAFGVGVGFNLDYLLTRHVALGVVVRYHAFLTDITRIPVYLFVGPRVTFRFAAEPSYAWPIRSAPTRNCSPTCRTLRTSASTSTSSSCRNPSMMRSPT